MDFNNHFIHKSFQTLCTGFSLAVHTGLTSDLLYTVFPTLLSKKPVLSWAKAGKDVKIKRKRNQFFYFSSVSSIRKITCHFPCAEWFNPFFFRRKGWFSDCKMVLGDSTYVVANIFISFIGAGVLGKIFLFLRFDIYYALSFYRSKMVLDRPNCFGQVQIVLVMFKLHFSRLIFIIWTQPKLSIGTWPKSFGRSKIILDP